MIRNFMIRLLGAMIAVMSQSQSQIVWEPINSPGAGVVHQLHGTDKGQLFALVGPSGETIYKLFQSKDQGQSWEQIRVGDGQLISSFASMVKGRLVAGGFREAWISFDDGRTWVRTGDGLEGYIKALVTDETEQIVVGGTGIFRLNFSDLSWSAQKGIVRNKNITAIVDFSDTILAGTRGDGIVRSTDGGKSWSEANVGLKEFTITNLVVLPSKYILAGTTNGLFRSSNGGASWSSVDIGKQGVTIFALVGNEDGQVFIGTANGVHRSTNNGSTWTYLNTSLTDIRIRCLTVDQLGHLVAGTQGGRLFRTREPVGKKPKDQPAVVLQQPQIKVQEEPAPKQEQIQPQPKLAPSRAELEEAMKAIEKEKPVLRAPKEDPPRSVEPTRPVARTDLPRAAPPAATALPPEKPPFSFMKIAGQLLGGFVGEAAGALVGALVIGGTDGLPVGVFIGAAVGSAAGVAFVGHSGNETSSLSAVIGGSVLGSIIPFIGPPIGATIAHNVTREYEQPPLVAESGLKVEHDWPSSQPVREAPVTATTTPKAVEAETSRQPAPAMESPSPVRLERPTSPPPPIKAESPEKSVLTFEPSKEARLAPALISPVGPFESDEDFVVVDVRDGRVYVNIGSNEGVEIGTPITLLEPVRGVDVNGKPIYDHVPYGRAVLEQVGDHSSIFTLSAELRKLLARGDAVRLARQNGIGGLTASAPMVASQSVNVTIDEKKRIEERKAEPEKKEEPTLVEPEKSKPAKQFQFSVSEYRVGEPLYFQLYVPEKYQKLELKVRRQGDITYSIVALREEEHDLFVGRVEREFHLEKNIEYYLKAVVGNDNQEMLLVGNPAKPSVAALVRPTITTEQKTKDARFDLVSSGFLHTQPTGAVLHQSLPITVYAPKPLRNPRLRYRRKGGAAYKEILLTAKPNDFYYHEIPEEDVVEPAIEYYLTVEGISGSETIILGNPENPIPVSVTGFVLNPALELQKYRGSRHKFALMNEVVQFAGNDFYRRVEGDYLYRILSFPYSIRMGMGALEGKGIAGSSLSRLYYYGFTEGEMKIPGTAIALAGRFIAGIHDLGIGSGYEGRVRFGEELALSVVVAHRNTARLGSATSLQFNIPVLEQLTAAALVGVENLPVQGTDGFRMSLDVGYEVMDGVEVRGRTGMAARTTKNIGYSAGLGFGYSF